MRRAQGEWVLLTVPDTVLSDQRLAGCLFHRELMTIRRRDPASGATFQGHAELLQETAGALPPSPLARVGVSLFPAFLGARQPGVRVSHLCTGGASGKPRSQGAAAEHRSQVRGEPHLGLNITCLSGLRKAPFRVGRGGPVRRQFFRGSGLQETDGTLQVALRRTRACLRQPERGPLSRSPSAGPRASPRPHGLSCEHVESL